MNNVNFEVVGDELVMRVKLSKQAIDTAPPSSTGKTKIVGTTHGSVAVGTHHGRAVSFALNVMAK